MSITDRYDGITIGSFCSERWLERNAVLSRLLNNGYFAKYRPDLTTASVTTPAIKKIVNNSEGDDESKVFEIVSIKENKVTLKNVLVSTFGDLITAQRVPGLTAQFYLGVEVDETNQEGNPQVAIVGNAGFENLLEIATTGVAGQSGAVESKDGLRYIPGYEFGVWFTSIFQAPTVDGYVKAGLFDGDNGFWIGYKFDGGSIKFGLCRVKDGTDNFVEQANFNIDKLDGTGESKFNIDPTKGNIYLIRGGYLGFAPIEFAIKADNGDIITFHRIEYPNSSFETHISNTNLPVRTEVSNGTEAEIVKLQVGSISAFVSDGSSLEASIRKFSLGLNGQLASGVYARRNLVAFKNEGTFNGGLLPTQKEHRIRAILDYLSISLDGQNKPVLLEIMIIPAADILSGTFTAVNPDSILEYSQDALYNFTNAKIIFTDNFRANISDKVNPPNIKDLGLPLRPGEHAVFALTSDTTLAIDYVFSNAWSELW